MIIKESPDYEAEFPEMFDWEKCDLIQISVLASMISLHILYNLQDKEYDDVAGLRIALRYIALLAEI